MGEVKYTRVVAPERLTFGPSLEGYLLCWPADEPFRSPSNHEYVRADLAAAREAELLAEIERLKRQKRVYIPPRDRNPWNNP